MPVNKYLLPLPVLQIRRLLSGMVCAQDGQLHVGDRLVSVNGVSLKGVTHSRALQLLKKPMELVVFVVLREGLETQGKASSISDESKSDSSIQTSTFKARKESNNDLFIQNSPKSEDSSIHTKTSDPSKMDNTEKMQSIFDPLASLEEYSESTTKVNKLGEFPSGDSDDESLPELPCSPPPPPLMDADDLLDGDLSIPSPPPTFSPLPPPRPSEITAASEDDGLVSSFSIVSPPPDLSPRMKEFMEQDLFKTGNDEDSSSLDSFQGDEILSDSCASLNQACSPDGWDFQTLPKSDDVNISGKDDLLSLEQCNATEAPLVSTDSLVLPSSTSLSQTKVGKTIDSNKEIERSFVLPASNKTSSPFLTGGNNDLSSEQSKNKLSRHDDEGLELKTNSLSPLHSKGISESNKQDVKPVEGRRVENVPFVVTFQKKFRSLGMKVNLSEDGKVTVTEVSSFGLVGKDGNIR